MSRDIYAGAGAAGEASKRVGGEWMRGLGICVDLCTCCHNMQLFEPVSTLWYCTNCNGYFE